VKLEEAMAEVELRFEGKSVRVKAIEMQARAGA